MLSLHALHFWLFFLSQAADIKLLGSLSRDDLKKICGENFPEWISFPVYEQVNCFFFFIFWGVIFSKRYPDIYLYKLIFFFMPWTIMLIHGHIKTFFFLCFFHMNPKIWQNIMYFSLKWCTI